MMEMLMHREEAQKALLDLFASVTGLPIGLYEMRDGQPVGIFSEESLARFEPHCQLIQSFPGGKAACEADMCNRARNALIQHHEELTLCHAGLYNQTVSVEVGGEVRAVLLYGEMRIDGDEYHQKALENHRQALTQLGLDEAEAVELRRLLLIARKYTPQQLEELKTTLPKVEQWFYSMIDEEERVKRHVEKVTHELQTRLQAVIAHAENLMLEARTLSSEEVCRRGNDVLNATEALDTVVQNLGQFMEEYRFKRQRIDTLLYEAKRVYQTEATGRGTVIRITLAPVDGGSPMLEISRHHLQLAFNNLVHNAVKYSFRALPGRSRYVRISGRPAGRCYGITIENYGVGILPEEIESGAIFKGGYQGKLTQGEYRTGSGKGLYFAKRVIDRHPGHIQVSSRLMSDEPNPEGQPHLNQFTIYLPYRQPKEGSRHVEDYCVD